MLRTPLYDYHRSAGARLVDFAGWEMPLVYAGIVEEHHYTRQHATFFDVSHMGRVEFRGPDAEAYLDWLNTRPIASLAVGQSRYSHMCRPDGGILDDVIVSRLPDRFLVVCNASNREKLLAWWRQQLARRNVEIVDRTLETAMIAVQGPEAIETLQKILPFDVTGLKRYHFTSGRVFGAEYLVARSGYTGEDGLELIVPASFAPAALQTMLSKAEELGRPIKPAGLGARDTLRTEAAMPLYGHELTEDWDPVTAGQAWVVGMEKKFCGCEVIQARKRDGSPRRLVGLEIDSPRTPRQGAEILHAGQTIGVVTSGVRSPTLERTIAMGFVPAAQAAVGTTLDIGLKTGVLPARVVPMPFYKAGS
jgi:aminomethyltransferase